VHAACSGGMLEDCCEMARMGARDHRMATVVTSWRCSGTLPAGRWSWARWRPVRVYWRFRRPLLAARYSAGLDRPRQPLRERIASGIARREGFRGSQWMYLGGWLRSPCMAGDPADAGRCSIPMKGHRYAEISRADAKAAGTGYSPLNGLAYIEKPRCNTGRRRLSSGVLRPGPSSRHVSYRAHGVATHSCWHGGGRRLWGLEAGMGAPPPCLCGIGGCGHGPADDLD